MMLSRMVVPLLMIAADADDAALDVGVVDDAAVGDDRLADRRAVDLAGGEETRVRVDGRGGVEEIELRHRVGELEIGVEEGADGADVLPVALVDVGVDAEFCEHVRDDVLAEIHEVIVERLHEHLAVENVNAHRRLKQLRVRRQAQLLQKRRRDAHGVEHARDPSAFPQSG